MTELFKKHPRLRGEDFFERYFRLWHGETPPLTRGRPLVSGDHLVLLGNTPAYAGKTFL